MIHTQQQKLMKFQEMDRATQATGVNGVNDLFSEEEVQGIAKITKFKFATSENPMYNMRQVMRNGSMFFVHDGEYVRLHVGEQLMMSDTSMERISNRKFIENAKGRVLIAGLGIGLVIKNIIDNPDVEEIVVIEKYQDVIDLVMPKFNNPKLKVICADIFDYELDKSEKFDCLYFDIWGDIGSENLIEMRKLHYKYRINKKEKSSFMESWMRDWLRKRKNSN